MNDNGKTLDSYGEDEDFLTYLMELERKNAKLKETLQKVKILLDDLDKNNV